MIIYDEFYPNYMGADEIEMDVSIVNSSKNFNQYKADGGFLDKLTYFEVLSQVRENRNAPQAPYARKTMYRRIEVAGKSTLKDISGNEYVLESGDMIQAIDETD